MAGSPKKRAKNERAAQKRLEILAQQQADERARNIPRRPRYTPKLAKEIESLIASGVPIEDSVLNGAVLSPGVATRLGMSSRTVWEWQKKHRGLAEAIERARGESAHRISDRMLALADAALKEPTMANAVRVAADILRWQAQVRNPFAYAERRKVEAEVTTREEVGPIEQARSIVFALRDASRKATLEEFIKHETFMLKLVAEDIATRGGGSLDPRMYEGKYADLAKGILEMSEIVARRLRGPDALPAPRALPAPAVNVRQERTVDGKAPMDPSTAAQSIARASEDDDAEDAVII
jgi:hypothetical protein